MVAQTAVLYNGQRLIPAPRVSFSRSHRRSADKSIIGTEHNVTLSGELVGCKGFDFTGGEPALYTGSDYPADDTSCDSFSNLVYMTERLRELFSVSSDYKWFEIIGCEGLVRKWLARVVNIDFAEGKWTDIVPYTITLELQTDNVTDEDLHIDHTETWDVQFDEESGGIYTLSHTLSCQSEEYYDVTNNLRDGWKQAKSWIDARLATSAYTGTAPVTIKNAYIFGVAGFNLVDYTAYNYTVQRSLDEYNGTYAVTETWVLSKDPVFRTWTIAYNKSREDYGTVSVDGEFKSFLDRTSSTETAPTNGGAALTAFNTWDADNSAFTVANAVYSDRGGCHTLGSCAVSKSVTIVEESSGDGTTAYGEATRSVKFSYEFGEYDEFNGPTASVDETIDVKSNNIDDCSNTVTYHVSIKGYECSCETSRFAAAQAKFAEYGEVACTASAQAAYDDFVGAGKTLQKTSTSYIQNEHNGTIEITYEFSDKFESGFVTEEKITESWVCGDLKSDGTTKWTYTVDGTIRGVCSVETQPVAPLTTSYGYANLKRKTYVRDATNHTLNYTYEFDDDDGLGLVEITVDTSKGPQDCAYNLCTITFSVQGLGCTSVAMLASATAALATLNAIDYAPVNSCQTSYKEVVNRTRGNVSRTYTFTDECDATIDVTITESYEQGNCEDLAYSVSGEIKGSCWATGGAMAAAEALFTSHTAAIYAVTYGCLASSRISRKADSGVITFNYDFKDCEEGYEHEQTVDVKGNEQDCCSEITLSGSIKPYCDPTTGESGSVATGEAAWAVVLDTLEDDAEEYCTNENARLVLKSTQVSRNRKTGDITYSYTYSCCETCIVNDSVLSESINISREFPADVVAVIPILGRSCGPLIQNKNTKTLEKCSIDIDILISKQCGCILSKPGWLEEQIDALVADIQCCSDAPGGCTLQTTYLETDREQWNPHTGRYTRNKVYLCEWC
jgi:hypothetical protein